jgi:hypothetical protein
MFSKLFKKVTRKKKARVGSGKSQAFSSFYQTSPHPGPVNFPGAPSNAHCWPIPTGLSLFLIADLAITAGMVSVSKLTPFTKFQRGLARKMHRLDLIGLLPPAQRESPTLSQTFCSTSGAKP